MSLYLQSNELSEDVWWILGALIVLGIVFFLTKRAQYTQRAKHLHNADPRQNVVNDTSYNINEESVDDGGKHDLSPDEARRAVDGMRESGHIPSEEEFHELRKDMKKDQ